MDIGCKKMPWTGKEEPLRPLLPAILLRTDTR